MMQFFPYLQLVPVFTTNMSYFYVERILEKQRKIVISSSDTLVLRFSSCFSVWSEQLSVLHLQRRLRRLRLLLLRRLRLQHVVQFLMRALQHP